MISAVNQTVEDIMSLSAVEERTQVMQRGSALLFS